MKILKWLGYFCAALLAVQVAVVLWGVLTRYLLGSQAGWTEELARYLLIWIALLGAAYVSGQRKHIAITLLHEKVGEESRRRLDVLISVIVMLFALAVLVFGGAYYVWLTFSLGQMAPGLGIPVGIIYLCVPLAGLLTVFFQINYLRNGRA